MDGARLASCQQTGLQRGQKAIAKMPLCNGKRVNHRLWYAGIGQKISPGGHGWPLRNPPDPQDMCAGMHGSPPRRIHHQHLTIGKVF